MGENLISVKDLSIRWQKDEGTIRRYVKEGILTPCSGVPGMMFHPNYIAKLEGVELERFSPLEKRRLENDIKILQQRVGNLSELLREYQTINIKGLNLLAI
jgi:transposase